MAKMVHGESKSAEISFGNMVRYAQASGSDAVCRAIINHQMGETGYDVSAATREEEKAGLCERRNIGRHALTVLKIIQEKNREREKMTLNKIVKEWRTKPENALPWYALTLADWPLGLFCVATLLLFPDLSYLQ